MKLWRGARLQGCITGTVLLSFFLMLLPLSTTWALLRPQLVLLTLLYWSVYLERALPVSLFFFLGLWWDAMSGTVLGAHASLWVLFAYTGLRLRLRFRVFSLVQQSCTVALMLLGTTLWTVYFFSASQHLTGLQYCAFLLSSCVGGACWLWWAAWLHRFHAEH